ncbi:unnamed protein product [Pleuronectes platessa]|uniref:Uncharacterized protein n=1 Tax=Pleuronectes platessa TaxID=8262 RepID=A0A9N7TL11_PLEPL|nr:unnamed protein product [Pleuronectes platessa]
MSGDRTQTVSLDLTWRRQDTHSVPGPYMVETGHTQCPWTLHGEDRTHTVSLDHTSRRQDTHRVPELHMEETQNTRCPWTVHAGDRTQTVSLDDTWRRTWLAKKRQPLQGPERLKQF